MVTECKSRTIKVFGTGFADVSGTLKLFDPEDRRASSPFGRASDYSLNKRIADTWRVAVARYADGGVSEGEIELWSRTFAVI